MENPVFNPVPYVKPQSFEITLASPTPASFSALELFVGDSPYDGTVGGHISLALGSPTANHWVALYQGGDPPYLQSIAGQNVVLATPNCKVYVAGVKLVYSGQSIAVTIPFEAVNMPRTVIATARHRSMPEQKYTFTY